ncbi:hypothetical protein NSQ43_15930 [Sporosarcina sp. FSL W8-0480]|uniref:phosphoribosyltransferase-like protein n=1 Tax=Sporosarcina sp. FSL W8-0480 TaxID=2954701 RepID=UPI0030D6E17E
MPKVASLVKELVEIAQDYENCTFDEAHVTKWLSQFPERYHEVIMREFVYIIGKIYVSKSQMINYVDSIIKSDKIFSDNSKDHYFLNIQDTGTSQIDLLHILKDIIGDDSDFNIIESDEVAEGSYVYIDDVFYTGNRLKRDIERWVEQVDDITKVKKLDVIYYIVHTKNYSYIKEELKKILPYTEISIWYKKALSNNIKKLETYDAYLPSDKYKFTSEATKYISEIDNERSEKQKQYIKLIRPDGLINNSKYFQSQEDRKLLEHLFFESGVKISELVANKSFKAMGYDYGLSLGFGSIVITYRNAPNNSPLVLWWGNSTLNNWYPLFPRIV